MTIIIDKNYSDNTCNKVDLERLAKQVRLKLCEVSTVTKTPHLGSCLSCVDILVLLYWKILNIDPKYPKKKDRDYFLLSKGHAASALYTILGYRDFFPIEELNTHGKDGSCFEEHPGIHAPPGVENISGSLGHTLSVALGMALAHKIKGLNNRFYVLIGDGELNEGTIWEAAMFASSHKLNNVTLIVDFNKWQGTGRSCDIMSIEPLEHKWQAFGWYTLRIHGHDHEAIYSALTKAQNIDQPVCIVADTIKGKGISFMEDDNNWHYRIPTSAEIELAKQEMGLS